jgi:hypothetical protein
MCSVSKTAQVLAQATSRISLLNEFGCTLVTALVAYLTVCWMLPPEAEFDLASATDWNVWAAAYLGLTSFLIFRRIEKGRDAEAPTLTRDD